MRKVALVVLAALAAACSSGGSDDPPPPPPPTGNLALVNSSGVPIHEVYVSQSTASWGSQRNGSTVATGTTFTVTGLDPALWNLKAKYNGSYSEYYTYASNVNVTADATASVYAYASGFTGSVEIDNVDYYGRSVYYLYFRPVGYSWGNDWLGAYTMSYGGWFEFTNLPSGYYDVWCEFSDGWDDITYNIPVSSLTLTTVNCGY